METVKLTDYPVLIVDDEEEVRIGLQDELQGVFTVFSACDAEEAFHVLQSHTIAVVVSDQRMPGMYGASFLAHVSELYPHIGRIILSGYDDKEDLLDGVNKGMVSAYVLKPWRQEDLFLILKREICLYWLRHEMMRLEDAMRGFAGKIIECEQQVFSVSDDKALLYDEIYIGDYDPEKRDAAERFMLAIGKIVSGYYGSANPPADIAQKIEGIEYVSSLWYNTVKTKDLIEKRLKFVLSSHSAADTVAKMGDDIFNRVKGKTWTREALYTVVRPFLKEPEMIDRFLYGLFMKYAGQRLSQCTFYTDECFGVIQEQAEQVMFTIYPRITAEYVLVPNNTLHDGTSIVGVKNDQQEYTWIQDNTQETSPAAFCDAFLAQLRQASQHRKNQKMTQRYPVLIVDDDREVLKALQAELNADFTVFAAARVSDALALLEKNEIGVILADQVMPDMNGVDFLCTVMAEYPDIRRSIVSAYADKEDILAAVNKALVTGYIVKPWDIALLKLFVRKEVEIYALTKRVQYLRETLNRFKGGIMYFRERISGVTKKDLFYRDTFCLSDRDEGAALAAAAFISRLYEIQTEKHYHTNRISDPKTQGIEWAYTIYDTLLYRRYVVDKIRKALIPKDFHRYYWVPPQHASSLLEYMVEDRWRAVLYADAEAHRIVEQMVGQQFTSYEVKIRLDAVIKDKQELAECLDILFNRNNGRRMGIFAFYNTHSIVWVQHHMNQIMYKKVARDPVDYILLPHQLITEGDIITGIQLDRYRFEWRYAATQKPVTPENFLDDVFALLQA